MADPKSWGGNGRFVPEGYSVVRVFSEHSAGMVGLARSPAGMWVALKFQELAPAQDPDVLLARKLSLQRLTRNQGLLPLTACGLSPGRECLWEELQLVDDISGAQIHDPATYEPSTLRREVIERGPKTVVDTIMVGLRICAGLEVLHRNGLVHRDVKPGNFFRLNKEVVLGDYGLTAPPGALFDFKGTEGFMPSDGSSSFAADLFALGKSLYEIWSGCDRLEFPTLPKHLLQSPEWSGRGAALNEVLLRASSPAHRTRYSTASDLANDLTAVCEGRYRPIRRRTWLRMATATAGAVVLGGAAWLSLPKPPRARYQRLRAWDHLPLNWSHRQPLVLDPKRRCVFSLTSFGDAGTLYRVDLETLEMTRRDFTPPTPSGSRPILDPEGGLLFIDRGLGRVWRLDPDSMQLTDLGGEILDPDVAGRSDGAMPYWNPTTKRLGSFAGYGVFTAHNFRWEFDAELREWVNLEPNDPGRSPWCRKGYNLVPTADANQLLLVGGYGNATGKQGQRSPGCEMFDGNYHTLGDLWSLDLVNQRWTCLIPPPGFESPAGVRACYLPALDTLLAVVNPSAAEVNEAPPAIEIYRLGRDRNIVPTTTRSDAPVGAPGWCVALPSGDAALMFATQGAFRITLEF